MNDPKIPTFAEWYAQQEPKQPEQTETVAYGPVGMVPEHPTAHVLLAMQQAQRHALSEAEQLRQAQGQRGMSWAEREARELQRFAAILGRPWRQP